jgi:Na+/H+-dicarboxylate symporter
MTIIPLVFALLVTGMARAADAVGRGGLAGRALLTFGGGLLLAASLTALFTPALLAAWPAPGEAAAALRSTATGGGAEIPPTPPLSEWLSAFIPASVSNHSRLSNWSRYLRLNLSIMPLFQG